MIESVIKPKMPKGKGWIGGKAMTVLDYPAKRFAFAEQGLIVLSSVEVVNDPNDIDKGPEYHVSISKYPECRASRNETKFVLKAFDMLDAEEDNHVPYGIVRNYWLPVNENLVGHECHCKAQEPAMRENKGDYVWRGITK